MAPSLSDNGGMFAAIGGWAVALIVALFTFIAQWRKGGVDETATVLGKWKELVEAHERQLASLNGEISSLRARVSELESLVDQRDDRIRDLEKELAGEKRQREQQARSFAEQLKRLGHNNPPEIPESSNGSEK